MGLVYIFKIILKEYKLFTFYFENNSKYNNEKQTVKYWSDGV